MRYFFSLIALLGVFNAVAQPLANPQIIAIKSKGITFPLPVEKMVMYEVFVRNFSKEGNFKGVTARLKELKSMGVNIIWLMPIQPTGIEGKKGTYGSPYAIQNYTEVNPDYGTKDDFKQLVDSCHVLQMNIIIDLVANHTAWDNAWVEQHPEWYTHDSTGKIIPPVADWTDVADLNFDNREMQMEMIKGMLYWVRQFKIDGYRCDVSEMVPFGFWKESIDSLKRYRNVVMLAEGADPKLYSVGFKMTYGWDFYHTLKKVFKGEKPVAELDSSLAKDDKKYIPKARQIRFITNHDENSWDNVPESLFGGLDGSKAAYVISACVKGVPLMYNGQEVAYPQRINLFEKYVIDYSVNPELGKFYSSVNTIRSRSVAITGGSMRSISVNNDVYAFVRELGQEKILVMVNVTNKDVSFGKPSIIKASSKVLLGENMPEEVDKPVLKYPAYGFQIIKL